MNRRADSGVATARPPGPDHTRQRLHGEQTVKPYQKPHRHTPDELVEAWRLDLLADAEHAEKQARMKDSPYRAELLAYAGICRADAAHPEVSLRRELGAFSGLSKAP